MWVRDELSSFLSLRFFREGEDRSTPVRYVGCGLPNVELLNGYEVFDHDGEPHVAVAHVGELHRTIACHLVSRGVSLSEAEAKFVCKLLR